MFTYKQEMAGTATTMAILLEGSRYILLGKRKSSSKAYPNFWCLPGGYLEVGKERTINTARREIKEECNIDIIEDDWHLFFIDDIPGSDPRYTQVINICYYAFVNRDNARLAQAGDDIVELKWVPLWEAEKMDLAFNHNEIITKLIAIFMKSK